MVSAIALEHLAIAYELRVVEEGWFTRHAGRPGPRWEDEGRVFWGRDAVRELVDQSLRSSEASDETRGIAEVVGVELLPALVRRARAVSQDERGEAAAAIAAALTAIGAAVNGVPTRDWSAGVMTVVLAPLALLRERGPDIVRAAPNVDAPLVRVTSSASYQRARARFDAAR